jgi:hypothetical protein
MAADAPRSPVGSPGVTYSDRFIPSRTGSNLASYLVELGEENAGAAAHSSEREARRVASRRCCAACAGRLAPARRPARAVVAACVRARALTRRCAPRAALRGAGHEPSLHSPPPELAAAGRAVPERLAARLARAQRVGPRQLPAALLLRRVRAPRRAPRGAGQPRKRETRNMKKTRTQLNGRFPCEGAVRARRRRRRRARPARRPRRACALHLTRCARCTRCRSPGRNLFRFMSDAAGGAPAESPFLRSPIGGDAALDAPGAARKPARKIARSPFKARPRPLRPACTLRSSAARAALARARAHTSGPLAHAHCALSTRRCLTRRCLRTTST